MSNEKLKDATAAFTFSRLPREQRIAQTLYDIFKNGGYLRSTVLDETNEEAVGGYSEAINQVVVANDWPDLKEIADELAKYSVKDFAVRYGHLADGKN